MASSPAPPTGPGRAAPDAVAERRRGGDARLAAIAVVFVAMGVKAVPQGAEYTVERFGRYMRTLRPGLHVITPFVERIGARLSMMEQVLE